MSMSMMEIDQALKQLRLSGMRATLETRIIEVAGLEPPLSRDLRGHPPG